MSDPSTEYKQYVLANLPSDIAIDPVTGFFLYNGHAFPTFLQASWYRNYIRKYRYNQFISLFADNVQGVWYDPSDLTTLFQDAAGTTPVTAPGQPVGLVLDKSGRGNHASQPTAAARPTLGRHPKGGRRNIIRYTEEFDNAVWTKPVITVVPNAAASPIGDMTADRITNTGSSLVSTSSFSSAAGQTTTYSVWLRSATGADQAVHMSIAGASMSLFIVTPVWQRFSVTWTPVNSGTWNGRIGNGSTYDLFAWGGQVEYGNFATPYQRVTDDFDVTEAGVPDAWYLHFNGVNQFLSTPTIDFTNSDEMFASAAVRKLSDASAASVFNLGANQLRAVRTPGSADFVSRGTLPSTVIVANLPAPIDMVMLARAKIGTDIARLTVNGVTSSGAIDQGDGNYPNAQMFIGAANGANQFLNGHLYGLVVSGKLPTEAELTATETILSNKMRIAA